MPLISICLSMIGDAQYIDYFADDERGHLGHEC